MKVAISNCRTQCPTFGNVRTMNARIETWFEAEVLNLWTISVFSVVRWLCADRTSGDVSLGNRRRYPTVTTFTSSGQGQTALGMRQFLRQNSWKIVTVLCDELSLFPAAASFYLTNCRAFQAVLTEKPGEFQMYYETYDSKDRPDYAAMLTRAKAHSRSRPRFSSSA